MALDSASELMTVPSMPIMSAVTRSAPSAATAMPRKMLPAPMTMAICDAGLGDVGDLVGHGIEEFRLDAERLVAGEHFARDLEQDAFVGKFGHQRLSRVRAARRILARRRQR